MSQQNSVIFDGRYEVQRRLGRGGRADVYLARDQVLDRPVAVKVLFPALATDTGFAERFRVWAQSADELQHANIVSVFDWGEVNSTYFIVVEYVEGHTLAEILRDEGRLHPDRAAEIAADIAAALGFAHRKGVVHRGVKPGKVRVTNDGTVKLADFGTPGALTGTAGDITNEVKYFSPEQVRGGSVDPRSDIYSVGCVLYEMTTGRAPFTGDKPVMIAYEHQRDNPVPPRQINSALPKALETITLKCLAKEPAERYPAAEDLRSDLQRYLDWARIPAEPAKLEIRGHVFISYSRNDEKYVKRLISYLSREHIPTWTDEGIERGDRWSMAIEAALRASFVVTVLMTPSANDSAWVTRELNLAQNLKKPIAPLLLKGDVWWTLSDIQYEDVRQAKMPSPAYVARLRRCAQDRAGNGGH